MPYTSVDKIANIRLQLHKVLPAVYDESLSYLEGLAKLTFKVNETINSVNALNDNVETLNDSVTDLNNRVTAVEGEIDGFEKEITKRIATLEWQLTQNIDKAVEDMKAEVNSSIVDLDERMTALEDYVNSTIGNLVKETEQLVKDELDKIQALYDSLEEEMKLYVQDTVNQLIQDIPDLTNIYVRDPSTGEVVKVQEALNNVYEKSLTKALTVDEFNELALTCNQLNDIIVDGVPRGMTCSEWLTKAKEILVDYVPMEIAAKWVDKHLVTRGITTGELCWLNDNIEFNTNMLIWCSTYTALELSQLGLTVDEIIAANVSCEDYIMRGNSLLIPA